MKIIMNEREYTLPSSLSEFTLGQRIDFQVKYGDTLDKMLKDILSMEDGPHRDLELSHLQFEKMFCSVAFFLDVEPDVLKESDFVDQVASYYYASLVTLFEDEEKVELKRFYEWNGEIWELQPPEIKSGSKMKFGEFIDSKQILKDMVDVGLGKFDYMVPLCAIYFRKKDERYQQSFVDEGSERLELMRSLTMDKVLAVGFFLSSSMNMYINFSQSSTRAEQREAVSLVKNILSGGVGSTF